MTFPPQDLYVLHSAVAKKNRNSEACPRLRSRNRTCRGVRVYTVLPGVNWTHRKHLDAGMKCETALPGRQWSHGPKR